MAVLLSYCALGAGCAPDHDFNKHLGSITKPYRFSIVNWELNALGEGVRNIFHSQPEKADGEASQVTEYFATMQQIKRIALEMEAIRAGSRQGDMASLGAELNKLRRQNMALTDTVERIIETQVREVLSQQGIFHPIYRYIRLEVGFPPVYFKLGSPPYQLVVSPRDRIESIREVTLLPGMSLADMENMEESVDRLGFSSLVVELGGFATYPSYVTNEGDLRFTLETVVHEWLHEYLAFKPLGFRYLLDSTGLRRNYDIATINETLVGMVSKEIGTIIYEGYYAPGKTDRARPETTASGFDFNQEMRETRKAVDNYLARGEIEQAEQFMEQKRQFLATKGYYLRKLNQAYFAFYGTYADSPTSISPIGAELKKLRSQSATLKDFLETVAAMTDRRDLAESVKQ